MKKLIIAISVLFLSLTVAQAQPYKAAFGLEGGFGGVGVTYKQFTGPSNFVDFKANLTLGGATSVMLTGTFDWNVPISGGFQFFYGLGAGAGLAFASSYSVFSLGVFGNLGLEYAFSAIPFAISVDWNPGYYASLSNGLHGAFGWNHYVANVGIKYTF
ncbi:MAG: hypothetical protein J6Y88_00300 [Bacteroidales bacterium]|nr:hypothetical protein [Bacteroidales bacterium]